jgi:hypothetical protein
MGLLDDAIREHLELKRLRGADPVEVARQEREVLSVAQRERTEESEAQVHEAQVHEHGGAPNDYLEQDPPLHGDVAHGESERHADPDPSLPLRAGQETAEIDMGGVFERDRSEDAPAPPRSQSSVENEPPTEEHVAAAHGSPDDDVLEETPDFLRDVPEQERLWFEQRPPRDFDFDR